MSLTVAVNGNVPAVVGVPVIAPLDARFKPVGSDPCVTDQVYGVEPPVALRVVEGYAALTVPFGSVAGVTVKGCTIVMLNDGVVAEP